MKRSISLALVLTLIGLAGCSDDSTPILDTGPDQAVADQAVPDQAVPDQAVPDQAVPDQTVPDQAVPDQAVPDQSLPDQSTDTVAQTYYGPVPYLQASDAPAPFLDQGQFNYFHLEDVEDGLINTPGLSSPSGQLSSTFGASLIDSVDGDDGNPSDGSCSTCDAWWNNGTATFEFDGSALGGFPTHAGLVWTDGASAVTFEAFDAAGVSLGQFNASGFADGNFSGGTAEDRFFGVIHPAGISKIVISGSGGIEADHIRYARQ